MAGEGTGRLNDSDCRISAFFLELGVLPPTVLLLGVLSLRAYKAHGEGLGAAKSLHVTNLQLLIQGSAYTKHLSGILME